MLALAGGACGLIVGMVGVRALLAINPGNIPRIGVPDAADALPLDWRVFAFTATVSLVTGLVFGVIPALHASRGDLHGVMKQVAGARVQEATSRRHTTRSVIVITEVALADRASDWRGPADSQLDRAPRRRPRVRSRRTCSRCGCPPRSHDSRAATAWRV